MYSFLNDYTQGAHPRVLQALTDTNLLQTRGYGRDEICQAAADQIRSLCAAPDADVHFFVGGTPTNLVCLDAFLQSYEAVIAPATAHVFVHETGAIEATGHKVLSIPTPDGKLTPELVEAMVLAHTSEHMVVPKLVYISDTTEIGTIYTKAELEALRRCCDRLGLWLYLDGARLGCALTARGNDLTLPDLAALADAFYIGGTKNGALFGEALVINGPLPRDHFRWHMKQRGSILAKGRLLGVQFAALLKDNLYFDLARHANEMALRLRDGIAAMGYPFLIDSPSNQQFPILPTQTAQRLLNMGYEMEIQPLPQPDPDHMCTRLVTAWGTPEAAVNAFLQDLASCR